MNKEYWIERYKREGNNMFATGGDQRELLKLAENNLAILFKKAGITHVENILDYGCGYGRLVPFLHKYADNIIGVDILIGTIKTNEYDFVLYMKPDELLNSNIKFDVIVTYTVMQHLFDNDFFDTMKLFYERLKPKGYYIGVERINPKHGGKHLNKYSISDYEKAFGSPILFKMETLTYKSNDLHTGFIFQKI